jgi:DNA polymerase I-like protein with 3'-5' exonuclease and polymerase domains
LNRLIQGSSADQTKKAMVDLYKENIVPLLTVHDELCFSIECDEEGNLNEDQMREIAMIMEDCIDATVPFKVDIAVGDNWGQID